MKNQILELKNVKYIYPTGIQPVLKGVDLKISNGEKIALLGNNGAGKSTLFLLMNGVLHSTDGDIYLDRVKVKNSKSEITKLRHTIGLVFQDPDKMFIAPTVEGEISFGLFNLGYEKSKVREIVNDTIKLLKIEELRDRAPHQLSGGEKKLVSIASILAMKPRIMLFDEPTAGLDPSNTEKLLEVFKILEDEGITVVISTHDMDFAWSFADRALILKDGEIIGDGNCEIVLRDIKLLRSAGLKEPIISKIGRALNISFPLPRNVWQLEEQIEDTKISDTIG